MKLKLVAGRGTSALLSAVTVILHPRQIHRKLSGKESVCYVLYCGFVVSVPYIAVTHLSTDQARRSLTSLIETNVLPLHHTATMTLII